MQLELGVLDANRVALRFALGEEAVTDPAGHWMEIPGPVRVEGRIHSYLTPAIRVTSAGPRRLWLEPVTRAARDPRLSTIRLLAASLDEDRVRDAARRTWIVQDKNVWRPALRATAGAPHVFSRDIPTSARLRFDYRVPEGAGRLAVVIRETGEAPALLFSSGPTAAAWRSASADLSPWAGSRVEIALEAHGASSDPLVTGEWSDPTIVVSGRESPKPHVLLVSIDTLRADRMSLYGYSRATTPRLDDWARTRGVVFEAAEAQAPWTLPSHVSILTGLHPLRHGVNLELQASRYASLTNLAMMLKSNGYRTDAITGGGFVHPTFGFARGFDRYRFWGGEDDPYDELESGVRQLLGLFDEDSSSPRFVFFHTYEVHPPNRAREPFYSKFGGRRSDLEVVGRPGEPTIENGFIGQPTLVVRRDAGSQTSPLDPSLAELPGDFYDSGIAYTDERLGRLFEELDRRGLLDRMIVIVTSDHGESLGEGGRWSHGHLDRANLHVPLVVGFPDRRGAGRRVKAQVRSIDIFPSVLEALKIPLIDEVDGRSFNELILGARASGPALESWSYGSSNNRGLAFRSRPRAYFQFQDSAYPPVHGRAHVTDAEGNALSGPGSASDAERLSRFRETVRLRWRGVAPGIHVRFVNQGRQALRGLLRCDSIEATTVKSLDMVPGGWEWAGRGKGGFRVAPSQEFGILLQDRGRPVESVTVELRLPGCRSELIAARDFRGDERASLVVHEESCSLSWATEPKAPLAIHFERRGGAARHSPSADGSDAQLQDQLQALGYI